MIKYSISVDTSDFSLTQINSMKQYYEQSKCFTLFARNQFKCTSTKSVFYILLKITFVYVGLSCFWQAIPLADNCPNKRYIDINECPSRNMFTARCAAQCHKSLNIWETYVTREVKISNTSINLTKIIFTTDKA